MATYKYEKIMKILAIIGGILALLEGILGFFGAAFSVFWGFPIIGPIIAIILGIVVILSVIRSGNPIPFTWIVLLILGILVIIFGSLLGGILVLIAGILGLIK